MTVKTCALCFKVLAAYALKLADYGLTHRKLAPYGANHKLTAGTDMAASSTKVAAVTLDDRTLLAFNTYFAG